MAYAKVNELADALHKTRFDGIEQKVAEDCLDSATAEIDSACDWFGGEPPPLEVLSVGQRSGLRRVCVNRGVEWWKAADAAFQMVGYSDIGILRTPREPFETHRRTLIDLGLKEQWGIA